MSAMDKADHDGGMHTNGAVHDVDSHAMTTSSTPDEEKAMSEPQSSSDETGAMASAALSHSLPPDSPLNPQNWPLHRRVLTSFQGCAYAFSVALGLTCFTAGKVPFAQHFNLSASIPEKFLGGFSLYLFGIAFAPMWVPHVTERYGRSASYSVYTTLNLLFNLGAGLSHTVSGVLVCRFFAGFFGGPCLVLLEGTFADIWSARTTNTYYAFQGLASFWGAGFGPLFGGYLVARTGNWRWTQYFAVIVNGAALLIGLGMSESYQREIPRRQARYQKKTRAQVIMSQAPAESGVTLAEMIHCTVIQPAIQFFTEPLVTLVAIIMFLDWLLTFQWFISVPAALEPPPPNGPGYDIKQVGLAYLTAVLGSACGALCVIGTEYITNSLARRKKMAANDTVEYRVLPAMFGVLLVTAALFWVGNTVNPKFSPLVPIIGTAVFVWGSSMITFSIVPYTFDLFQPAGTLSAITCQAVGRIIAAGILPLLILQDITSSLTPKWGFGLFGFISLIMWPIPILLFVFGKKWRMNSRYSMMCKTEET